MLKYLCQNISRVTCPGDRPVIRTVCHLRWRPDAAPSFCPADKNEPPVITGAISPTYENINNHHNSALYRIMTFVNDPVMIYASVIIGSYPHSNYGSKTSNTIMCNTQTRKTPILFVYQQIFFKLHTYIPLTLYPQRGSRGISDISPRLPRFTKIS
jgi:hypothetical protein